MYVNETIPMKQLSSYKNDSATLFLEILEVYKHSDQSKSVFLESLSKNVSIYLDTCEKMILENVSVAPEKKNYVTFRRFFWFRTSDKETNLFHRTLSFHRSSQVGKSI